jgi:hypothetical protein
MSAASRKGKCSANAFADDVANPWEDRVMLAWCWVSEDDADDDRN